MKTSKNNRDVFGWQPSQNVAFLIIAGAMIVGGALALLLCLWTKPATTPPERCKTDERQPGDSRGRDLLSDGKPAAPEIPRGDVPSLRRRRSDVWTELPGM